MGSARVGGRLSQQGAPAEGNGGGFRVHIDRRPGVDCPFWGLMPVCDVAIESRPMPNASRIGQGRALGHGQTGEIMTDQITNQPPAGWYPDPRGSEKSRWWDGHAWSDHVRAAPTTVPAVPAPEASSRRDLRAESADAPAPASGWAAGFTSPAPAAPEAGTGPTPWQRTEAHRVGDAFADQRAGTNSPAQMGLVFGIVSILFNPLLLVGITSFILSLKGLARARKWESEGSAPVGRKKAVWGLVLSPIGTVIALIVIAGFLSGVTGGADEIQFDKAGVEKMVTDGVLEQVGTVVTVKCPDSPSMTEGNEFQCVATADDGSAAFVNIRVQDAEGNITWQLQ